jgi:heat shock protein HslJ
MLRLVSLRFVDRFLLKASATRGALLLVLLGAFLAAVAGCGGDDSQPAGPPLEGTAWTLQSGVDAPADAVPTLTLSQDGQASGFAGCNTFSGGYEVSGDTITLGPLASTQMACPDSQMAAETSYFKALEAVDTWSIQDSQLVLSDGDEERLRYSAG